MEYALLPVAGGGTGNSTFGSPGGVLIGSGTSAISTKSNPTGAFLADSDVQNVTGAKTFTSQTLLLRNPAGTFTTTLTNPVIGAALSAGITPILLSKSVIAVDVTNTTTETDVLSYNVPAGLLSTNNIVRVTIAGTFEANSGSTTLTFRIKYGATTMYADVTSSLGATASVGGWSFIGMLSANNSTSAQNCVGFLNQGARAAATSGYGDLTAGGGIVSTIGGTAAENSATALDFKITAQWSAANSTYHWRALTAIVELLS